MMKSVYRTKKLQEYIKFILHIHFPDGNGKIPTLSRDHLSFTQSHIFRNKVRIFFRVF